ncbi:60S ribosomal protein l3 [Ceratobasidium theobromae]|uniref:Large ribosomal subunit protein mL44 n=1 Tax=Ceratobasidium theobromae TaxID=1582974 RepID=A0A5N5QSZ5_9AGAM|nr:60S ribosomal protein l3 [Ceratobasidium theobromae]
MNHPVFKRLNKPPSAVSSRSFPPPEGLSSHDAPTVFDAKVWASLQPPPPSALATFAARLSLPVTTATTNSERAIALPLLAQAVTHPSFISLHQQYYPHEVSPAHNGMLATLGNHLMGLFAAEWLAATYPHLPTLALKAAVSAYVGPKTASQVAEGWGAVPLVRWRRMSSSPTRQAIYHEDAMASVARAVVGLVYHAHGSSIDEARKFVHAHFLSREFDMRALLKFGDPKLMLIHTTRKYQREPPVSRLLQESGRMSNSPTFVVGVFSGQEKLGEGFGSSLKMAEYRAAENAMHRLYLTRQPVVDSMLPTAAFPSSSDPPVTAAQSIPKSSFDLLELSASLSCASTQSSNYTPGILGESEALYGSAGRTGSRMTDGVASSRP